MSDEHVILVAGDRRQEPGARHLGGGGAVSDTMSAQEQHECDVLLTYLQQHHPGFVAEVLDLADQVSVPLAGDLEVAS